MEAFANPLRRNVAVDGVFPGDGMAGANLLSFSLDRTIFFGFANSFIREVFDFGSLSGTGPRLIVFAGGGRPGDGRGLLPLGNATFAAVVAANLLPPTEPLMYPRLAVEDVGLSGLWSWLGRRLPGGPAVLIGVKPG